LRRAHALLPLLAALLLALSAPPPAEAFLQLGRPGTESRSLDTLQPDFRRPLEAAIAQLRDQGWPVYIRATRRDLDRQRHYASLGHAQTLHSLHRQGRAADLLCPLPWPLLPAHAAFFRALARAAATQGLCTGAAWSRRGPWALFDLGWDPAHVQPCSSP
jgi:hypothetical protein